MWYHEYDGQQRTTYIPFQQAINIPMKPNLSSDLADMAVLERVGNPVMFVDREGRILQFNPAAMALLGLDQAAIGQRVGSIFGISVTDMLFRAWERNGAISAATTVRRLDPKSPPVFNVSVSPLDDNLCVLIWQDISGLREGERARVETEKAATKRVLDTFSRYMSAKLADRILSDPDILSRREMREAVVMFADLRGFTRLTVEHPPNLVLTVLHDWFSQMMDIVNDYEGLVFNTAGDELMISFNVPYTQQDVNLRAIDAAIAMQQRFGGIQSLLRDEQIDLGMGIGINRGMVVLGHVGGRHRMTYTMVGEAVNLAHRLVEIADDAQIVMTEDIVAEGLPDDVIGLLTPMPPAELKGITHVHPLLMIDTRRPLG